MKEISRRLIAGGSKVKTLLIPTEEPFWFLASITSNTEQSVTLTPVSNTFFCLPPEVKFELERNSYKAHVRTSDRKLFQQSNGNYNGLMCKSAIALGNSKEGKNSDYMDWFSFRNKQKGEMFFQELKFIFFIFNFFLVELVYWIIYVMELMFFFKKISFTTWLDKL